VWLLGGVYVLAKLLIFRGFVRVGPGIFPDSTAYLLPPGPARPFTVPFLNSLVGFAPTSIVVFQSVLSCVAWLVLAAAIHASPRGSATTRRAAVVGVLLLSLSQSVSQWDALILSESYSFSLMALLAATVLTLDSGASRAGGLRRGSYLLMAMVVLPLLVLFSNCRDANAYLVILLAPLLWALFYRFERSLAFLLVFSGVVASVAWIQMEGADRGLRWRMPLTNVVRDRVLPDAVALRFFIDHGMPNAPFTNPEGTADVGADGRQENAVFASWMTHHGLPTFRRYLMSEPARNVFAIVKEINVCFYTPTVRGYGSGTARMSGLLDRVVFFRIGFGLQYVVFSILLLSPVLLSWNGRISRDATHLLAFLIVASFSQTFLAYHADSAEIPRHCLTGNILFRAVCGVYLLILYDACINARDEGGGCETHALKQLFRAHVGASPRSSAITTFGWVFPRWVGRASGQWRRGDWTGTKKGPVGYSPTGPISTHIPERS